MTNKFKVGDDVRVKEGRTCGNCKGKALKVIEITNGGMYPLNCSVTNGNDEIFDEDALIKVESSNNFNNTKIRVSNPEESERVQKRLFELGYEWHEGCRDVKYTSKNSIYIYSDYITFSDENTSDSNYFDEHDNREITVNELLGTAPNNTYYNWRAEPVKVGPITQQKFEQEYKCESMEVETMEEPTTKLEKDALKKAKEDVIEQAIKDKAERYETSMRNFMSFERQARSFRKQADELAKKLGITSADKKNLF